MPITSYEDMKEKKADILGFLSEIANGIDQLGEIGLTAINGQILLELKEKIKNDNFKVLVIGEFKNGKSTFINSLMGEKVLPAYSTPCTAVINEVVYGKEKKAVLYFKNPLPEEMSPDIVSAAMQHIRKYQNAPEIPPYEIDVEDLEEYVAIPDPCKDQADSIKELPYSKVILEYPISICRDGIEIIDSPGLNENGTRTKVTEEYLNQADAILFVFRCPKIGGVNEVSYITDQIQARGHEDIFFICNCINLVPEDERERLIKFGNQKLAPLTSLGENGIFYVDALNALKSKNKHDTDALAKTGMPEFEMALSEYLRNNRGKNKLLQIVIPCISFIQKICSEQIDSYARGLDQDVQSLEKKIQSAMPNLNLAIERKKIVSQKIALALDKMKKDVSKMIDEQYTSIMNKIPTFINNLDLDSKMTVNPFTQKERKAALEQEVTRNIDQFIQSEMGNWIKGKLAEYMGDFISDMETELGGDIDQFYDRLDGFRYEVSGIEKPRNISGFERVGATILGTLALGPAYGLIGATMGLGEVTKRSALAVGAIALMSLTPMGITSIATTVVGAGFVQFVTGGKALADKYKKQLAKSFVKQMQDSKDESIQAYVEKLSEDMAERFDTIPQALQQEINLEQNKVDELRKCKDSNEKIRAEKLISLNNVKAQLENVEQQLIAMKKSIE